MEKDLFRFRSMGYAKDKGKVTYKMEVFAPTLVLLRKGLIKELVASGSRPTFSYVDRIRADVSKEGAITFKEMIAEKALDGNLFAFEVLDSKEYKESVKEMETGGESEDD